MSAEPTKSAEPIMSAEPAMNAEPAKTAFAQFQSPGLTDGTYTVTARIVVSASVPDAPTFRSVQKVLRVGTDTPSVPLDSIISVFPPETASGDYSSHLPHVVFNQPTLPWQREVSRDAGVATSWLALLLLTDAELRQPGVTVAGGVKPGGAKTLSLPGTLFRSLAPSLDELSYLAHVRNVDATSKDDGITETDYAVVVCNRLPPQNATSNAFLVSLAERGPILSGSPPAGTVELAVMYAWRFFSITEPRSFADVVSALDVSPATLSLPQAGGAAENPLAMGYVPLPHALRVGGGTVSWYRGPFVPQATPRRIPTLPITCADAVTFYDPTTGMMDLSCSAAWSLGRLMALNASGFAKTLYNWKRATQRATLDRIVHELDTGQAPETAAPTRERRLRAEERLAELLPEASAALGRRRAEPDTGVAARPTASRRDRAVALRRAMTDPGRIAALHGDPGVAEDSRLALIWAWLGDLNLLKTVPLFYLVPDERMLPPESIRFFQVDPSWLEALTDGALSIGRVTEADASHDAAFHPLHLRGTARAVAGARGAKARTLADADAPPARPLSGFLLRSSAVSTWPRMEAQATGPRGPANILRMDAAGTLMVCLFDDVVETVALHPPSEGMNFGFDFAAGRLTKNRRRLAADGGGGAGTEILDGTGKPVDPLTTVPYRAGGEGVLDIATLAGWFVAHLGVAADAFTSAEFALEMVAGAEKVVFDIG